MNIPVSVDTPPFFYLQKIVRIALEEDISLGDVTSTLLVKNSVLGKAHIIAKEPLVVAGVAVAKEVFRQVDPTLKITTHKREGTLVKEHAILLTIKGNAHSLLQGERVALNFLQHLSGISSLTREFCQSVRHLPVKIVDTRKTTPGLRVLEKWAVRLGGASNHRFSLSDGILIKDNHLALLKGQDTSLREACILAKKKAPHGLKICVEVENLAQVRQALQARADVLLLDNMTPKQIQSAKALIKDHALVEISGGVSLANIRELADRGPDFISIGALTHSAPAKDISMSVSPLPALPQKNVFY